jgi:hypothetical protein
VDPIAEAQPDKTPYHFCSNNPINRTDPTGMIDGDTIFKDADGNTTKTANDGSTAIFQEKGSGIDKHYEHTGFDYDSADSNNHNVINLQTAIQEAQILNDDNTALDHTSKATYCNYATQNILKTIVSATDNSESLNVTGMANSMADNFSTNPALVSTTQAGATSAAANGGLAVLGYNNANGHGHVATFSVGDNVANGIIANIGAADGFMPIGPGAGGVFSQRTLNQVQFYTLSPTVTPKYARGHVFNRAKWRTEAFFNNLNSWTKLFKF